MPAPEAGPGSQQGGDICVGGEGQLARLEPQPRTTSPSPSLDGVAQFTHL